MGTEATQNRNKQEKVNIVPENQIAVPHLAMQKQDDHNKAENYDHVQIVEQLFINQLEGPQVDAYYRRKDNKPKISRFIFYVCDHCAGSLNSR
jgi:hypothetical protein